MGGGEDWVRIEVPIWAIKERAKGEKMLREDKGERAFANGLTIKTSNWIINFHLSEELAAERESGAHACEIPLMVYELSFIFICCVRKAS